MAFFRFVFGVQCGSWVSSIETGLLNTGVELLIARESAYPGALKNPFDCRNRPIATKGPKPAINKVIFKRSGETCFSLCLIGMVALADGLEESDVQMVAVVPLAVPLSNSTGFIGAKRVPSLRGWPRQA